MWMAVQKMKPTKKHYNMQSRRKGKKKGKEIKPEDDVEVWGQWIQYLFEAQRTLRSIGVS